MDSQLSRNLRFLRDSLGLSQEELATRVGANRVSVVDWESGRTVPRSASLLRLADVFGCSIAELRNTDMEAKWQREHQRTPSDPAGTHPSAVSAVRETPTRQLPLSMRVWLDELRLRLTRADVPEVRVDNLMAALRDPRLHGHYAGGYQSSVTEQEQLQDVQAIAEVIIRRLRREGFSIE